MARLSRRQLSNHIATRLTNGDKKADVLGELAAYLVDTRRTGEAELLVRDIELALAGDGVVVATVISARKLDDQARKLVESYVRDQYPETKQVSLRERIDESLLAGIRLELPDRQLDESAKAKLERLTV